MHALKTLPAVTVATAGTRVQVSATNPKLARAVRIEADGGNTGVIYVGDANVSSSRYAAKLSAGDSFVLDSGTYNLALLWLDASSNAQKAQVSYV